MSLPPSSEYMWWVEGLCSGGGSGPCWFSSRYLCQLISIWMAGRPLHASSMGERRCCLNTSVRSSWFRLAVLISESFRGLRGFGPTVSGFGPTDSRCVLVGWLSVFCQSRRRTGDKQVVSLLWGQEGVKPWALQPLPNLQLLPGFPSTSDGTGSCDHPLGVGEVC